jgi:hypothetical protein
MAFTGYGKTLCPGRYGLYRLRRKLLVQVGMAFTGYGKTHCPGRCGLYRLRKNSLSRQVWPSQATEKLFVQVGMGFSPYSKELKAPGL